MDMRQNWLLMPGCMLLLPTLWGCQQTTGTSPLTPIGPLGSVAPLSPVSGGTAANSLSPLGQPTRVPPPPTGSYSAPNNYMGGAPAVSQLVQPVAPYDSFSRVAPDPAIIGRGVAPTTYLETNRVDRTLAPSSAPPQTSVPSSLDGMRVIDMTQAPAPPGYRSSFQPSIPQNGNGSTLSPQASTSQGQAAQSYGGSNLSGAYAPSGDFPPQNIHPAPTARPSSIPMQNNQLQDIHVPRPGEIAVSPSGSAYQRSVEAGASATIASREFPLQPSPNEPSFRGSSQFSQQGPSTDPVDNSFENQPANLPWRRPGTQY